MSASNGSPEERISASEGENPRLRDLLAEMTKERDAFKRMFYDEADKNMPPITQEDIERAVPHGPWYREMIERIRRGDPHASESIPPRASQSVMT